MEKKLIHLIVPAAQKSFDVFVPGDISISGLTDLLARGVTDLCNGQYTLSNEEMLNLVEPEMLLDPKRKLSDYGIRDGAAMILI